MKLPVIGLLTVALLFQVQAAHASTQSELNALKEEVKALREGQEAIQKDLTEIKRLLEQGARAAPAQPAFRPQDLAVGDSPVLGAATAPVTLIEFSDYQCPFCKRHATTVMPELVREYVDTGKVRIVMREFPIERIHPLAMGASSAALCARDQGKYWPMHDLLFADQKALQDADLRAHAETLSLDTAAFDQCLRENRHKDEIAASLAEGRKLGISGTPSFVAGRTDPKDSGKVHVTKFIRGAQPLDSFKEALDELLGDTAAKD